MIVSIIADDNIMVLGGRVARVDLSGIDPMYHAVQFNTDKGWGEIEYREIDRDGDGPEPPYKPRNEIILAEHFENMFGGLVLNAQALLAAQDAEDARIAALPVEDPQPQSAVDPMLVPVVAELQATIVDLNARLADMEAKFAALAQAAQAKLQETP